MGGRRVLTVIVGILILGTLGLSQNAYAPQCLPAPSGLVGWWPGDGNADDIADGNPGALMGGTAFATGKVGQAFSLDGSNDFINVPGISAPTDKTYSLWVKVDATPGRFNTLIEFGGDAPWFGLVKSGAVELFPNNPETPTTISTGVFTHIAYTSDSGTNKGKIYINGVQNGADGTADTRTTAGMGIGFHAGDTHFDGLIDEVQIFDRALSASEILAIFKADSTGMCKGPAANLIQDIKDLGFDKKIEKSLIGPLKQASKILNDGNPNNDQAACDKLTEFLDNLAAKADKIDDTNVVDALEADAQAIKDAIGCS